MHNYDTKIQSDILLAKPIHLLVSFAYLVPFVSKRVGVHAKQENHSKVLTKKQMLKVHNQFQ